jgi:hypothetical protein
MTESTCLARVEDDALVQYWLGELDEDAQARIEPHLLACGECSERLAGIVALADGVRRAVDEGAVRVFVTDAFVRDAARRGMRVREYRVPRNGSVHCSVAPEDDLLVGRMDVPLAGVERLDAFAYVDDVETGVFRDVPFDAAKGEVVLAPKLAYVRTLPSHVHRIRLVAVSRDGERVIGDYTFNHTAYPRA